ncbi:heterokaryon incompatibility protein-domain-containing protein [Xylaria flabelliformis]|nr:heterokaryon incompatibility protein-domain-containing protein [Xylaria flabelliformis]
MAYVYEPLPKNCHTRVLELYPALDPDAPLHGHFRFVNLENDPFYDAISYTWGKPHFTEEIFIGESSRLCITPNLRDALVRYRQPTEIRSIWADAICIDQANEEDKRRQIPSMGDIFRCASSVLVWLGKEPSGEACLRKISLLSQRRTAPTPSDMAKISSALSQLVSLSWFSRRWVIQELVLNPNVFFFCGAISIPWLRATQLLKNFHKEGLSSHILHLYKLRETWELHNRSKPRLPSGSKTGTTTGIIHLLSNFYRTDCLNPRDRIYALLGIASDVVFEDYETRKKENKILIRIDYTQSVKQVYHDFAPAVQQSGSNNEYLLLLETARGFNCAHISEWAAWVPDWRLPIVRSHSSIPEVLHPFTVWYGEYSLSRPKPFFGEIEVVYSVPYPKNFDRSAKLAWLRDAFALIKKQLKTKNNYRPKIHYWQLLASTFMLQPYDGESSLEYNDENAVLETFELRTPSSVTENRCLFTFFDYRTRDTLRVIGIGPCHIRSGDMFLGHETYTGHDLIVLREADESQRGVKPFGMRLGSVTNSRRYDFMGFAFTPIDTTTMYRWMLYED